MTTRPSSGTRAGGWLALLLAISMLLAPIAAADEPTIGPRDVLTIMVWGQPDLSHEYLVEPDGFVPFPLVGRVKAAGLAPKEFAAQLKAALEKDYLVNPQVIVSVKERLSRKVTVFILGEVKKPGSYQLDGEASVLEGITLAGGFTDKAAPGRTRILRNTPNGQEVLYLDMNDVMKRGQREKAVQLKENDVVVVPESFF
ncbi:MAG TPA: polysaccharide biosynthesis/export family protein [Methylomirabilota bacterium]|nr:polysaccharide biosynthesis/export family protein [Methylomirabilota bacterium]